MAAKKTGERHHLLFYRRTMDRLWRFTFILAVVLFVTWGWRLVNTDGVYYILSIDSWVLLGAILASGISFFAFISRFFAYVQARDKYLKIVTPFLRINVSYRRMLSVRPLLIQQIFPKDESKWAERKYLEPFYGKTALVVEMRNFPENPAILKLFFPSQMFSRQVTGFVLLVPDWMKFSMEMDSYRGSSQQEEKSRERAKSIRFW
jgi:hypothetical protein